MSKPCPDALSQGGLCAGDCAICPVLNEEDLVDWDDEEETGDDLCPYRLDTVCLEDCIDCPGIAEDWATKENQEVVA